MGAEGLGDGGIPLMPAVLICADEWSGPAPDTEGLAATLVEGLCLAPSSMVDLVPVQEEELVLALHRSQVNLGEIQAVLRRLGFDPLSVAILDLASVGPGACPVALAGALARARAYPGARPDPVKLLPADRRTRRGFLSVGTPTYTGAPRVDPEVCVAGQGCRVCAVNCPAEALTWSEGVINYDPNACVACGVCVTACPTGAVENPVVTPEAIAAEIDAVVRASTGTIGIRYRCREAMVAGEPGWYQVEVPCTGMLTVGWLLAPLALGAGSVDAIPCSEGGCGIRNDERLTATMADAAVVIDPLGSVDFGADRIVGFPPAELFSSGSTGRLLSLLTTTPLTLDFGTADVGSVVVDPQTCTACLMCAQVCPTGALLGHEHEEGVSLDLDPRLCVACGQCVAQCPEVEAGAIELTRRIDLDDWPRGRREVRRDATPRCEICGGAVAPESMLTRIAAMLGDDHAATLEVIGKRCVDCRGR